MLYLFPAMMLIAACSDNGVTDSEEPVVSETPDSKITAPDVTFTPGESDTTLAGKPQGPIQISYRIIGEPIVGQPVAIDLLFASALGAASFDVSYRVNDSTALQFPESQPLRLAIAPTVDEGKRRTAAQQVTVIPMREGRLYLNVAAQVETDTGSMSSVTAVPIQVGKAPREIIGEGTVTTDENGELIRTLPAEDN